MAFFSDLEQHLGVLREVVGAGVDAAALPAAVVAVSDAEVLRVVREATAVMEAVGSLRIAASGVLAARSRREQGHDGLAAGEGHRDAASLVQEITGTTRADAVKQVKLGESLLDGANLLPPVTPEPVGDGADGDADAVPATPRPERWFAVLGRAQLAGRVSADAHSAILRGLGDPPVTGDPAVDAEYSQAWALAAEQLIEESKRRTVEELRVAARTIRDRLDPRGAEERSQARFQGRGFKMWRDADGITHGRVTFDDEAAAFLRGVFDAALRPRRGGPRFVDAEEAARAAELRDDPRTNEQLQFDLLTDLIRAGALADAETVYGTRQAGVRVVVTAHDFDAAQTGQPGVAHTEDGIIALPAAFAAQKACDTGTRTIWIDGTGEPLRLGRERRLYTPAQRLVIAVRDGGCLWGVCDRPASLCETHHIDHYSEGGATDTDRGLLLCHFHHMELHHGGWRITREGHGPFLLHPPPDANGQRSEPIVLKPRLALTYAWAGIDPPPPRFRFDPRSGPT